MRQHRSWLLQQEAAAVRKAAREAEAYRRLLVEEAARVGRSAAVADALAAVTQRARTLAQLDALLSDVAEFRRLQLAASRYGDAYAQAAVNAIEAARAELIIRSQQVGITTTMLQTNPAIASQVAGMLQLVPVEKVSRLAGLGANASPLRSLASMGEASSMRVLEAMLQGAARGDSPRRVAQLVASRVTDAAKSDVLRVTRTEMLRASRGATTAWAEANSDVIDECVWYAELDDATCAACWAMHGEVIELGEDMGTHPNCRCAQVLRPKSPEELGFVGIADDRPDIESGIERFGKLSAEQQRMILGPKKYEAYADGRIGLGDVVQRRESDAWGTTRSVASLDTALANAGT